MMWAMDRKTSGTINFSLSLLPFSSPSLQQQNQQNTMAAQDSLGQTVNTINTSLSRLTQNVESINNTGIASQINSVLDTRNLGLPANFSAELRNIQTHENCNTTEMSNCVINPLPTVSPGTAFEGSTPCLTADISLNTESQVSVIRHPNVPFFQVLHQLMIDHLLQLCFKPTYQVQP